MQQTTVYKLKLHRIGPKHREKSKKTQKPHTFCAGTKDRLDSIRWPPYQHLSEKNRQISNTKPRNTEVIRHCYLRQPDSA